MPLYLVERTLPFDRDPALPGLEEALMGQPGRISGNSAQQGAVWICSLLTPDGNRSFCLFQGPNPETVRIAAAEGGLPIDRINEVRVQALLGIAGSGYQAPLYGAGEDAPPPRRLG